MKQIFYMIIIGCMFILLNGCSSKNIERYDYNDDLKNAPDWVFEVQNSPYTAVASAKISPIGLNFAEVEATAVAKDKIARQIKTRVYNVVKQFTQTTGFNEATYAEKVVTDISRQVSTEELSNVVVEHKWISPSGLFFLKLSVDRSQTTNALKKSLNTSDILEQQAHAKEAQKELESYLEKNL